MKVEIIKPTETYDLRHRILRPHQPITECHYPGDFTGTSFHLGCFKDNKLVSIGSFYQERNIEFKDLDQFRLRGMASHPEARGLGCAKALLKEGERIAKQRGATFLWCNARENAFEFYTKVGYSFHGPFFDLPEIGRHKIMFIRL